MQPGLGLLQDGEPSAGWWSSSRVRSAILQLGGVSGHPVPVSACLTVANREETCKPPPRLSYHDLESLPALPGGAEGVQMALRGYLPEHGFVHVHTTSHHLLVVYADPAAGSQRCGYLSDSILMQSTVFLTS